MTELNTNTSEYLAEAVHITVCNQCKTKYVKLLDRIERIKRNITYKIEKVMPRLIPNENAIMYGKETQSNESRQKRAIPLGLIFSGVSAIGGLIMSTNLIMRSEEVCSCSRTILLSNIPGLSKHVTHHELELDHTSLDIK